MTPIFVGLLLLLALEDDEDARAELGDITHLFFQMTDARWEWKLLQLRIPGAFANLLAGALHAFEFLNAAPYRATTKKCCFAPETGFPALQQYYALIEIWCIAMNRQALPGRLSSRAEADIRALLKLNESHSREASLRPLLTSLLHRIAVKPPEQFSAKSPFVFQDFAGFVDRWRGKEEIHKFIHATQGPVDWSCSLFVDVSSTNREPSDKSHSISDSMIGFQETIEFCVELDSFLKAATDNPRFQSACWHFFRPFYGRLASISSESKRVLRNWHAAAKTVIETDSDRNSGDYQDLLSKNERALAESVQAIESLLESGYGRWLDEETGTGTYVPAY